jgi:hypothetical protein
MDIPKQRRNPIMLYVKTLNPDGTLTFAPIRNDNIYLECKTCGRVVPICDVHEFIEDLADLGKVTDIDLESDITEICEECEEEKYVREDEYCREHYPQNYPEET